MKELENFRQFLAEGDFYKDKPKPSPEALIKVFQDEIRDAKENEEDDIVPAYEKGIEMLKQGGDPYEVNGMVQDMYVKITGDFSYDPTLFIDDARKIDAQKQLNENQQLTPAVVEYLKTIQPEEVPGSWDDVNNEFVVPLSYEELAWSEEDLLDMSTTLVFMERDGMKLSDLPTEWTEFETFDLPTNKGKALARNFAKFVPGEGLYYKVTSEYPTK